MPSSRTALAAEELRLRHRLVSPVRSNPAAHHAASKKEMSLNQLSDALNLRGQTPKPAARVRLDAGQGPKLDVAWGSFHQGIGSSIAAVLSRTRVPRTFLAASFFKDSWVERRIPRRALVAAALWHVVFIVMPSPRLPAEIGRAHV